MDDPFVLEVEHNGTMLQLETRFLRLGYTYKFSVMIDETEVLFERDEQGSFRAVLPEGVDEKTRNGLNMALLKTVATTLQSAID